MASRPEATERPGDKAPSKALSARKVAAVPARSAPARPQPPAAKKRATEKPAVKKPANERHDTRPSATGKSQRAAAKAASKPGLLRAGLSALGNVRDDVVKRQTHVIESLLGLGKSVGERGNEAAAPSRGLGALDSFGIRKFEDVFDQRIAGALQRLGLPGAAELQALRDELAELRERLDRLDRLAGQARTAAARRKR